MKDWGGHDQVVYEFAGGAGPETPPLISAMLIGVKGWGMLGETPNIWPSTYHIGVLAVGGWGDCVALERLSC